MNHKPVLLDCVLAYLPQPQSGFIVDATFGGGGYSKAFLEKGFRVIAFEKDKQRLNNNLLLDKNIEVIADSYAHLSDHLFLKNISQVDAIVFDLGLSSFQIDDRQRGFSWKDETVALDMRMNQEQVLDAAKVLNQYEQKDLEKIFFTYGEEPKAKWIAAKIVQARQIKKFVYSQDLLNILRSVYGWRLTNRIIARNFQAIRIEVNDELEEYKKALEQVYDLLVKGGRLISVAFHSLEDRITKNYLRNLSQGCTCPASFPICKCGCQPLMKILTKKPLIADEKEIAENIRARSAKMRVGEKI